MPDMMERCRHEGQDIEIILRFRLKTIIKAQFRGYFMNQLVDKLHRPFAVECKNSYAVWFPVDRGHVWAEICEDSPNNFVSSIESSFKFDKGKIKANALTDKASNIVFSTNNNVKTMLNIKADDKIPAKASVSGRYNVKGADIKLSAGASVHSVGKSSIYSMTIKPKFESRIVFNGATAALAYKMNTRTLKSSCLYQNSFILGFSSVLDTKKLRLKELQAVIVKQTEQLRLSMDGDLRKQTLSLGCLYKTASGTKIHADASVEASKPKLSVSLSHRIDPAAKILVLASTDRTMACKFSIDFRGYISMSFTARKSRSGTAFGSNIVFFIEN